MMNDILKELKGIGADVDGILELFGSDASVYERLLKKFINDESYYQGIIDSIEEGDFEEAVLNAHTLEGAAANLGFTELSAAGANILTKLQDGKTDDFKADLERLTEEYNKIKNILAGYIS